MIVTLGNENPLKIKGPVMGNFSFLIGEEQAGLNIESVQKVVKLLTTETGEILINEGAMEIKKLKQGIIFFAKISFKGKEATVSCENLINILNSLM